MTTTARASTSVAVPAVNVSAILALAAGALALQGVSIGVDPKVVGYEFAVGGALDPATDETSPNVVDLGTWTPSSWDASTPAKPPEPSPVWQNWPQLVFTRLTVGSVTGNIIGSADPSTLSTSPASTSLASLPIGSMSARIATPGASTRVMLDKDADSTDEVDLWAGNASLTNLGDTSATVYTPALGAATFTVTAGKGFYAGLSVRFTFSSSLYFDATVTSYSGVTLVVTVTAIYGTPASHNSWTINFVGAPPGYWYVQRLSGGGQSALIGEGTTLPTGLYLYAAPAAGSPTTLFVQGITSTAGTDAVNAENLINPGNAVIQAGGSITETAGTSISETATTSYAAAGGTTASLTGGTGVTITATTGDFTESAPSGQLLRSAKTTISDTATNAAGAASVTRSATATGGDANTDTTATSTTGAASAKNNATGATSAAADLNATSPGDATAKSTATGDTSASVNALATSSAGTAAADRTATGATAASATTNVTGASAASADETITASAGNATASLAVTGTPGATADRTLHSNGGPAQQILTSKEMGTGNSAALTLKANATRPTAILALAGPGSAPSTQPFGAVLGADTTTNGHNAGELTANNGVDQAMILVCPQTTAGVSAVLPTPSAGRICLAIVLVPATATQALSVEGVAIAPGEFGVFLFDGAAWATMA